MGVDEKLIEYLAELSKIELDENEKKLFSRQMVDIIGLMDSIGEADIEETLMDDSVLFSELREDISKESLKRDLVLENAPIKKDEFFVVPKIVEQE